MIINNIFIKKKMLNETQLNELISKSETMSKSDFDKLLTNLNDKYYNSENDVDIPDDYYDMLKDNYENRFGEWTYIGANVDEAKSSFTA